MLAQLVKYHELGVVASGSIPGHTIIQGFKKKYVGRKCCPALLWDLQMARL